MNDVIMFVAIWFALGMFVTLPNPSIAWGDDAKTRLKVFGLTCFICLIMGPGCPALLWLVRMLDKRL